MTFQSLPTVRCKAKLLRADGPVGRGHGNRQQLVWIWGIPEFRTGDSIIIPLHTFHHQPRTRRLERYWEMVFFGQLWGNLPEGAAKLWFGVWEGSETVLHRWELVTRVALILLHCCNKPGSRERMQEVQCSRVDTREKYAAIRGAGSLRKPELHHLFTSIPPSPGPQPTRGRNSNHGS